MYELRRDDSGFLLCRNCGRTIESANGTLRHVANGRPLCSASGKSPQSFHAEPLHAGDTVRFLVSPVSERLVALSVHCPLCGRWVWRQGEEDLPVATHLCRTSDDTSIRTCLCMECAEALQLNESVVRMYWLDGVPIRWCGHRQCIDR